MQYSYWINTKAPETVHKSTKAVFEGRLKHLHNVIEVDESGKPLDSKNEAVEVKKKEAVKAVEDGKPKQPTKRSTKKSND